MDVCHGQYGLARLPPVIICLLWSVRKSAQSLPLDQATQTRISTTIDNLRRSQSPTAYTPDTPNDLASTYAREQFSRHGYQHTSPQINPPPTNNTLPGPAYQQQQPADPSLLNPLLPTQLHLPQSQSFSPHTAETDFTSPDFTSPAYDPNDLDSFFDELASLHGAKKLQNQPQFMQNLGFAPEISMADLLATQAGQYPAGMGMGEGEGFGMGGGGYYGGG